MIGGFRSDLSITCMIDGNFGNVSAGVLFMKVAYQWWHLHVMSLHGKLVAVASHGPLNFFFLNLNDDLDTVLSTDLGEQQCFKFLIRQFVSLNKMKIICSMADRKGFVACAFCGVEISYVIGYITINIPDIFWVFTVI